VLAQAQSSSIRERLRSGLARTSSAQVRVMVESAALLDSQGAVRLCERALLARGPERCCSILQRPQLSIPGLSLRQVGL
jgi:hypothetical protein